MTNSPVDSNAQNLKVNNNIVDRDLENGSDIQDRKKCKETVEVCCLCSLYTFVCTFLHPRHLST